MSNLDNIRDLATKIRVHVLRMAYSAKVSHIGSCLSIADILSVLYSDILKVDPASPNWLERDRLILSKGHSCAALYAVLAEQGFFPKKWLESYCQDDAFLFGHVTYGIPGVEVSTGSLGHGLSIGCGMSLASKKENRSSKIFVLLSDGELDEGSNWEAILFASHHQLDNLIAIVDYNKLQALGTTKEILNLEPLIAKWNAFSWGVREIDGHSLSEIEDALRDVPFELGRPSCIIAHTIKGKGVSFMENQFIWHYKSPNAMELEQALIEVLK